MKKMYNNPKTEAVRFDQDAIMTVVGEGSDMPDGEWAAPARKAANPLQGQIKM